MISFQVEDNQGVQNTIEIPEGISLSLMEVLKASDYPILATCGGMALCATCHISVINGEDQLLPPSALELDMIDTLPNADCHSRLACQIRVEDRLQGATFLLKDSESV